MKHKNIEDKNANGYWSVKKMVVTLAQTQG